MAVTQSTGAMQDTSNPLASLAAINTFVGMLKGGTSSQTQQSNITPEGMNYLLTQILSGSQGLAPIASGQKAAGLYNSVTNTQLLNDLSTRASGELAAKQAGTTTINRQNPSISLFPILAAFAGTKLLGPTVKIGMEKLGIPSVDQIGTSISDAIWGAGSTAGSPASLAAADTAAGLNPAFGSLAAYDAAMAGAAPTSAGAVSEDALASYYGADTAGAAAAAETAAASEVGGTAAFADVGMGAAEAASSTAAVATAAEAAGTASEGAGLAELAMEAAAVWVICTELEAQNRLSKQEYLASAVRALDLHPTLLRGYHWWAVPVTRWMRKSTILSRLLAPIARARCRYLLGKFSLIGALTVWIGEPICHLIGLVVSSQNWQVLYE